MQPSSALRRVVIGDWLEAALTDAAGHCEYHGFITWAVDANLVAIAGTLGGNGREGKFDDREGLSVASVRGTGKSRRVTEEVAMVGFFFQ